MKNTILKVEGLCASYGDLVAVDKVDLEVEKGQIAAIIGLNNAGKSTLVNTIVKAKEPTAGKIFFRGEDITSLSTEKIISRGLSLVPQGGRCFKRMSVEDNLLMGCYPKRSRQFEKETLAAVFELFPDLLMMRKSPAGSLSGGQRQMVAIGRALMNRPECLIFDEISLGLSPVVIKDIYRRIKTINEKTDTTIVLIEQDTHRVLGTSDVYYVMLKGRIVLSGKSSDVDQKELKKAYFGV